MKYKNIILLNWISIIESFFIKIFIDNGLILCNIKNINNIYDIISIIAIKNIITLGGYQIYFWSQRNFKEKNKINLKPTKIDKLIPAIPEIYWIYSPLYYLFFSITFLCLENYKTSILNAWIMVIHASIWFILIQTEIPKSFRIKIFKKKTDKLTKKIIKIVHFYDTEGNACPSMHCAFSIFLSLITYKYYNILISILFPLIISISCLICKQHLIMDILPGFILGGIHGYINLITN